MSVLTPRVPKTAADATILVVGVGGIGTPCAWALADAGVGRLVLIDPDVVETSNLPRQILFSAADVGRPKSEVAAGKLARAGLSLEAAVGRFDETTAGRLLSRVDVVVDGTDGAATKDLVQRLTVDADVPFVHAAALGSEGRVLDVPAGGRPCLACLFGSPATEAEGDTCARHGVFPGVTGTVGALAAIAALDRLARPRGASRGLRVLDLGASRGVTLRAETDPECPVCGPGSAARRAGAASGPIGRPAAVSAAAPSCPPAEALDLREESCPMNLLRARRAIDRVGEEETLEIWLGEEGAATVPEGLASVGHRILASESVGSALRIRVRRRRGGAQASEAVGSDVWLRRYARQIVLPDVGEDGQRRIQGANVRLRGAGTSLAAAAVHLAAAGVGTIELSSGAPRLTDAAARRWPFAPELAGHSEAEALAQVVARHTGAIVRAVAERAAEGPSLFVEVDGLSPALEMAIEAAEGPIAQAGGALAADAAMRAILGSRPPSSRIRVSADGTVSTA